MDRGRESRRGGGGTVSGHGSSSRRRPRSGFKDSSVVGEEEEGLNESHDSARLRERSGNNNSKKERSSLSLSSSRNKRKRPGLQERFHGSRDNDGGGGDESSEDSAGDDEDEDEDEPPRPPNPARRTAKFKSQWKVSEEIIGVGLVSVPRKARSASVKRGHDSSAVSVTAVSASDGHAHRQSSPSPARPGVIPVSPSSSNVSVKPARRMKPIGTKPRASKMAKVSNSISEREVEVAEVLFGLTRQFQTHHPASESYANTSKPDMKESSNDASVPAFTKVSSPIPASSVVSSPISAPISPPSSSPALTLPMHSSSTPAPAVAPKRKRPRPAKPEETNPAIAMRPPATLGSICTTSTTANVVSGTKNEVEQASQATKMEVSSSRVESNVAFTSGLMKGIPSVASTTTASSICMNSIPVSTPSVISIQREIPLTGEKIAGAKTVDSKPITSEKMATKIVDAKSITMEKIGAKVVDSKPAVPVEKKPCGVPEELDKVASEASEAPVDQNVTKEIDAPTEDLPSAGPDVKAEDVKMSLLPKTENTSEEKFKIDLMAPPAKSSHDIENDSGRDGVGNTASELPEKETVEIANVSEVKAVTVKKEREQEKLEEGEKEEEMEKKYDKRDDGEEKSIEKPHVKERNIELQLEGDNLEKDSSKQQSQKQGRISRGELRTQKPERPASAPVASGNVTSSASAVASLPIPITVAGWPGGLPPLGYFGPVAANWSGAPSLQVVSMEGNNTTPTMQPAYIMQQSRQSWKRCAIHSHIAHFIDCQQKMAPHPFWAAANYGSSAALYGAKPYNLNMPLPPPLESTNLGGPLQGSASASSVANSGSISRNLGLLQDRIIGSAALAAFGSQNPKEKAAASYIDAQRKQPLNQQTTQQTPSPVMQLGPAFGFPITQSGSGGANLSTVGNTGNVASSSNSGNPALGAAPSAGTGAANGSLPSMTGAEAQYLAMLQQSGYSFTIPPAHFGATYNGGQQQGAQFFNGSFYAPQLLHPPPPQPQTQPQQQPGPQNPSTSSGSSSSQKHQQQLQGSRNFSSAQKQQQGTASPSPSNSQQQHHLPASQARQIEREASNGADSPSTADSRFPINQKSFFGQGSPSNSNFNINPASLLATGMPIHPQDLAFMAALGGKHNNKQQQQPPPQIGHLQQPAGAGFAVQQHHGNDSTIQMSLKGLELNPSQALVAMSRIPGTLGFPSIAQGHAALQGIPEPARHPHQIAVQAQQIALQSGQQSQRSGQMQRAQVTGTDEGRNSMDSISNASGRGREDDRKMPVKGGLAQSLNFSRIDTENSTNMQGLPTDGGLSTSSLLTNSVDSMGRTLQLIVPPGNGNRNTRSAGSASQGNPQPPAQQLNQNTKQAMGRAKNVPSPNAPPPAVSPQTNLVSYGDHISVSPNVNKFQASASSFPGQNQKQVQQSSQWKMGPRTTLPSNMSSTVGVPSQAILAAHMTNYPQQGRNQQGNSNLGATSGAPPSAAFASSTKSSGQPPVQQNNSSSVPASRLSSTSAVPASVVGSLPISPPPPASKSVGTPALRVPTGSKGPISQQKSIAPISNKKSSPGGGRNMPSILSPPHISQSSSGKSSQQQYQLQQSAPPIGSGQAVPLKNQQYHNQAHFNQQQIFFSPSQYLQQQAVQQSQLSSQPAHQTSGFHQKQQMHGSSSPQLSFSNAHLRRQQDQQQQMQPVSSPSSNAGALSLGPPTLTLGGATCVPGKIVPSGSLGTNGKGSAVLHVQYNPLNGTGPNQQQCGSPHATLSSQYMQAATNVSAKSAEQKAASDGLNQDQVNGVRLLQNSINLSGSSVQARAHFNASSPQGSSIRMPAGSLKKAEGGNNAENVTNPGSLSLSMQPSSSIRTNNSGLISSGNAAQHAKASSVSSNAVHSGQISQMPMHPPPVSMTAGPISPATGTPTGLHGQAATSVVQP